MTTEMIRAADISPCGAYRYRLTRTWGDPDSANVLCVVMLNPSTADALLDDPTIRRCISFAQREGCDGLEVLNAYALRATDPRALRGHPDPVGGLNDVHLQRAARHYPNVTVAWGANIDPVREARVRRLLACAPFVSCWGTTKDGHPRHPLYLRSDAQLVAWNPLPVTEITRRPNA